MPAFAVVLGKRIAAPFLRMDMHHNRTRRIFYGLEHFNQRSDIVTLFQVLVIKTERLEVIVLGLSASCTEFCQ